jgi:acyl-CoA thioester hydrolase
MLDIVEHSLPPRSADEALEFVHHWAAGWNRCDLEAVLAWFADDVELVGPAETVRGKPALRAAWQKALAGLRSFHIELDDVTFDPRGPRIAVTYRVTSDGAWQRAIEHFTFGRDGRIARAAVYHGGTGAAARDRPPSLEDALAFPRTLEAEVEPGFIDAMGHMNVMWYVHLFDRATWSFLASLGIDSAYLQRSGSGMFALDQRVRYLAELRQGDRIEVHSRLLEVHSKWIRFAHVMVDVARQRIAATTEFVGTHVDIARRRARPFPDHVAAGLRLAL